MPVRDTHRSNAIVEEFNQRAPQQVRRNYSFTGTWHATAEQIFQLLCPAREADWIPKWSAKILYSSTGYAEDKCIFETPADSAAGEGVWTFSSYKQNQLVEYVGFGPDSVTHGRVTVSENSDGTTSATWDISVTALTQEGISKVSKLPQGHQANSPAEKLVQHFLEKGEVADMAALGNVHE